METRKKYLVIDRNEDFHTVLLNDNEYEQFIEDSWDFHGETPPILLLAKDVAKVLKGKPKQIGIEED